MARPRTTFPSSLLFLSSFFFFYGCFSLTCCPQKRFSGRKRRESTVSQTFPPLFPFSNFISSNDFFFFLCSFLFTIASKEVPSILIFNTRRVPIWHLLELSFPNELNLLRKKKKMTTNTIELFLTDSTRERLRTLKGWKLWIPRIEQSKRYENLNSPSTEGSSKGTFGFCSAKLSLICQERALKRSFCLKQQVSVLSVLWIKDYLLFLRS